MAVPCRPHARRLKPRAPLAARSSRRRSRYSFHVGDSLSFDRAAARARDPRVGERQPDRSVARPLRRRRHRRPGLAGGRRRLHARSEPGDAHGHRRRAARRAQGARLGFWCEPAADGQTTSLIIVDGDGRLELRVVEGAGPGPELYRAIALKLRALLAASIGPEAPPAPVEAPSLPPPPLGTPPVPPTPAPPPTAPPNAAATVSATIVAPPPPAADSGRFFAALGYRISAPLGSGSLQQGATGEAGLRLGRAAELALGLAVETHATDTATIGTVSVFDLPIDVAARFVHRGRRVSWGGGGFLAAHLLWATANGFE